MIRRPPRSTQSRSSAASDVYKRQVVSSAERSPQAPFHLWIEDHPVCGVAPVRGNPVGGRGPGGAAIVALESADVGVADDDVPGIEGVEVHAVVGGHVQAARGPGIVAHAHRVHRLPGLAPVEGAVGAEQIGGITDIRIGRRHTQAPGRVEEDVAPAVQRAGLDPGIYLVLRRLVRLLVNDGPGAPTVSGLADPVERVLRAFAQLHAPETRIGHAGVPLGCGNRLEAARRRSLRHTPTHSAVFRDLYLASLRRRVNEGAALRAARAGTGNAGRQGGELCPGASRETMNMTGPDREQSIRTGFEFQNPLAREVPLSRPTGAAV